MIRAKLPGLGLALPPVPKPFGAYVPAKRAGNHVFVAGQLPMKDGKLLATGRVPSRCTIDQARDGARQCVLNALSAVWSLGIDPDELAGVIRVGVFINSDDSFTDQPKIANAASELLVDLFGEPGSHARVAVGVNTLPLDAAVEIEFLFELGQLFTG